MDAARRGIAIDAAQIKGVLPLPLSSLRVDAAGVQEPGEQAPGGLADRRAVPLRLRQRPHRGGVRPSCSSSGRSRRPGKPLFEAAAANFSLHSPAKVDTDNDDRGPLLLIMGGQDHTVPEAITKSTLKQYRALRRRHRPARVRGPRPLADHRRRLAGGRRGLSGVAGEAKPEPDHDQLSAPGKGGRHERCTPEPSPRRRHRRWVRRVVRNPGPAAGASRRGSDRPHRSPPVPAAALPGCDRHPLRRPDHPAPARGARKQANATVLLGEVNDIDLDRRTGHLDRVRHHDRHAVRQPHRRRRSGLLLLRARRLHRPTRPA